MNNQTMPRIDADVKDGAAKVLKGMGLSVSSHVRMALTRAAVEKELPFEIRTPNEETARAVQESDGECRYPKITPIPFPFSISCGIVLHVTCAIRVKGKLMATLNIRLPDEMNRRLDELAEKTGRTKTFYAKEALERFLEDMEDAYLAEAALIRFRASGERAITHEEMGRKLGLDG